MGIAPLEAQQIYRANDASEAAESFLGGLYQHYMNVGGLARLRAAFNGNIQRRLYLEACREG